MPIADLPMALMFLIFLLLFVVIGIYPAFQRAGRRLRRFIREHEKLVWSQVEVLSSAQPTSFETPHQVVSLNDFEIFILRRLAQAGGKGLTRRQINADLHFDPVIVKSALAALIERGLVQVALPLPLRLRYGLSPEGREFAIDQGYLPRLRVG